MPILVTQLTPPVATRWATVAQVTARLLPAEVSAAGAGLDSLVGDLLDEASEVAVGIVGRPLARAQYSQLLPGYGTQQLRLARGPLEGTSSDIALLLRGSVVDPALYAVDSEHALLVRTDGGLWDLTPRYAGRAPGGAVQVGSDVAPDYSVPSFWAGYRMPEQPDSDPGTPLRASLRAVAIGMVLSALREIWRGGRGLKSVKKADRQIEWYGRVLDDSDTQVLEDERDLVWGA